MSFAPDARANGTHDQTTARNRAWTTLAMVRRRMALALLSAQEVPEQLGEITLQPHQRDAARRLGRMIARDRGALLADAVGSGKTYTALAIARNAARPIVVAPAVLRDLWNRALLATGIRAQVLSVESLSRALPTDLHPDLVIIDESHHLRNASTRRYGNVTLLCASSNVLLLSGTPLQNRRSDLAAQLALFLGERALMMSDDELAAHCVRRARAHPRARLPAVHGPHWLEVPIADDWLDDLLSLPAVVLPADGGDGGALLSYVLVRRWASSRAALLATLKRRLAAAIALESALEVGRRPTRRELSTWHVMDDAMQLAFPELAAMPLEGSAALGTAALLEAVRHHRDALHDLTIRIRASPDPDVDRARILAQLLDTHRGEIIVAFSEHAETIDALASRLMRLGGVVALTSHGARTASGRHPRAEVVEALDPAARPRTAVDQIRLLLSTDVLSEGVNLHRASVIVHVDLPWNPARLEQRVGRVRRLGSQHQRVTVYALSPPADSERLLDVEQRLRRKLDVAARAVGVSGRILPPPWGYAQDEPEPATGRVEIENDIVELLQRWNVEDTDGMPPACRIQDSTRTLCAVGALAHPGAQDTGYLVLVRDGVDVRLLAGVRGGISTESCDLHRAITLASAARWCEGTSDDRGVDEATAAVARWMETRSATRALGNGTSAGATIAASSAARRAALARLARIGASLPRQSRASTAPLLERVRLAVARPLSLGAERILGAIVDSPLEDAAWLQAINGFAQAHAREPNPRETGARTNAPPLDQPLAFILFVP